MSFNDLSPEIRRCIWSFVADETVNATPGDEISRPWGRNRSDLARCALVNSEWRDYFERALFRNLFLTQDTFQCLHIITPRQKKLVRYIWLRIDIHKDGHVVGRDLGINVHAGLHILRFLRILSYWTPGELGTTDGLTVEISFYPSDDTHRWFRNDLFFDSSPFTADVDPGGRRPLVTNTTYGILNGKRCAPLHVDHVTTLFYGPLFLPIDYNEPTMPRVYDALLARLSSNPAAALPTSYNPVIIPRVTDREHVGHARVVTRLVLRRQTRRHIDWTLVQPIMSALPELKSVTYEQWREWREFDGHDTRFRYLLGCMGDRVQDLQIFEDFNEEHEQIIKYHVERTDYLGLPLRFRKHSPDVSEMLVRRSLTCRRLAASYMIEACYFFRLAGVDKTLRWETLESLQLTSHMHGGRFIESVENQREDETNETLRLAGWAAARMPRLKKLDIWFAERQNAFCFSYRLSETGVSIQWRGTWDLPLHEPVLHAWSHVALLASDGRHTLTVLPSEIIDPDIINSNAKGIKILGLGEDVLHPVSFQQMIHETDRYFFGFEPTQELLDERAEQRRVSALLV